MNSPKRLSRPLAKRVAGLDALPPPPRDESDIPSHVIEAAAAALARGETHYTDRPGIPEFRQWVADFLARRFGLETDPTAVTITCGSTEARYVTMTLLANPASAVLCPGNAQRIQGALHLLGAQVIHSLDAGVPVSVLYLTPGDDRETVMELLHMAESMDWWIVYDLSFTDDTSGFHPAQNDRLASRVVTINSLSDDMAGWRLGWMAGSEAALRLRAGKQAITICTTAVSQWAGLEFVRGGDL